MAVSAQEFRYLEKALADRAPDAIAEATHLSEVVVDPREATVDEIWPRLWEKPLYAHNKVATALRWRGALQPHVKDAWKWWGLESDRFHVKRIVPGSTSPAAFRPGGASAGDFVGTGVPLFRLFRIQGAAAALRKRSEASKTPFAVFADEPLDRVLKTLKAEFGEGWGPVTVLHFLTDLGLAVKPDLHLVRTCNHLGISVDKSAVRVSKAVADLTEAVFGVCSPRNLRYTDKVLMEISRKGVI